MPDVRIKNETSHILNIALSQVAPLHFSNAVAPGGEPTLASLTVAHPEPL